MSSYDSLKFGGRGLDNDESPFVKTGLIFPWTTATAPSGYLLCSGAVVSRTTYADLFAVIGTTFGSGDGSSTFGIPDLRGKQIVFDDAGSTYTFAANAGNVSNNVQPNITKGGNINVSVNGNTGNFSLGNSHLPSHTHAIMGNSLDVENNNSVSGSNSFSRNSVFHRAIIDQSDGVSNDETHNIMAANPSGGTSSNSGAGSVNLATTSNAFNGNANAGAGHAHSIGVNGSANYASFTLNASSESVNTLFSSVVLNAIIKT